MDDQDERIVTIVIPVLRLQNHLLPLYLACLYAQTWPKAHTVLYINTNVPSKRTDSQEVVHKWVEQYGKAYNQIIFCVNDDNSMVDDDSIIRAFRESALRAAIANNTHCFMCNCNNFIAPNTIERLMQISSPQIPIIAPLLREANSNYANFHADVTPTGFFSECPTYYDILERRIVGVLMVPVVNCCYLIHPMAMMNLQYKDNNTARHEYIVFSESARVHGVQQYIDNRFDDNGYISFANCEKELVQTKWWYSMVAKTDAKSIVCLRRQQQQQQHNVNGAIIISPQCGLGNRMRALASGIAVAIDQHKQPYVMWTTGHLKHIYVQPSFEAYFKPQPELLPTASTDLFPQVDRVLSEWLPGDGWYDVQCDAQAQWLSLPYLTKPVLCKIENDQYLYSPQPSTSVELIETSKRLSNIDDERMSAIYRLYFQPHDKYVIAVNTLLDHQQLDMGIHIRRGYRLLHVPESRLSVEQIATWLQTNVVITSTLTPRVVIFSDDGDFKQQLQDTCRMQQPNWLILDCCYAKLAVEFAAWEIAFIEFLILSQCKQVYATPGSSFSEEAVLFGGSSHIYTPIDIKR